MTSRTFLLAVLALAMTACGTWRGYEGPTRDADEVATVRGDLRFTAGVPLSLILRSVDGHALDARYNSVELLPGEHTFIVDCVLTETHTTSRHQVTAEVYPGTHYGFTAEMSPGMRGCASVDLTQRN